MITFIDEYGGNFNFEITAILIVGIVYALIGVAFYLLRSIGLYKLALRNNAKQAKLSFVPFVWLYVACKLIGEVRFFNKTYSKLAKVLTVIFTVSQVLVLIAEALWYFPVVGYVITEGANAVITVPSESLSGLVGEIYWTGTFYVGNNVTSLVYPYPNVNLMYKILRVLDLINMFLDIAVVVITISVYLALFRKFWPQHYILASILSALGLFAPFVFIIRKNKAVQWSEYARSRYNYYTPYNKPYGNQYGRPQPRREEKVENPFSEFSDESKKNDEPFSEFSDNDREN